MSAPLSIRRTAISATLPLPAKSAGSGFARRAVITSVTVAPADSASAFSTSRRSARSPSPKSISTSSARSPRSGRSSIAGLQHAGIMRPTPTPGTLTRNRGPARTAKQRGSGFAIVFVRRHGNGACGNDGRDGVLVHHLGDRILQQHDVLIERLDLTLQFDAVDEVDRDLYVLLAESVQERVL